MQNTLPLGDSNEVSPRGPASVKNLRCLESMTQWLGPRNVSFSYSEHSNDVCILLAFEVVNNASDAGSQMTISVRSSNATQFGCPSMVSNVFVFGMPLPLSTNSTTCPAPVQATKF